jgi:hypothetical protein
MWAWSENPAAAAAAATLVNRWLDESKRMSLLHNAWRLRVVPVSWTTK